MALLSIAHDLVPLREDVGQFRGDPCVPGKERLDICGQVLSPLGDSQAHSIAIFGGVLKKGSTPSRTLAFWCGAEW